MLFMVKHDMFYHSQYGFKKGSSTEHAVIELQNKIACNLNDRLLTAGIFLDLSKAFDTLDHDTLIYKLNFYGIRGIALEWVKSYLLNRYQIVNIGSIQSSPLPLKTGVPQGSILGPLLFIIFINDMHACTDISKTINFADDTCLLFTSDTLQGLQNQLDNKLDLVNDWLSCNKLSLNISKTKCVLFHSKHQQIQNVLLNVVMNNSPIEIVDDINFLGIHINKHLDWKIHVSMCGNKISRSVYTLKCLKNEIPHAILLTIYNALIQSTLNYGLVTWYSPSGCNMQRLIVLQKKALRYIFNAKYNCHTNPLFVTAHVLKLDDLYVNKCILYYWKCKSNMLPTNLIKLLLRTSCEHETRNIFNTLPKINLEVGRQMFLNKITYVVQKQPPSIKSLCFFRSFNCAKSKLKYHSLSGYSTHCNISNCYSCNV